MKKTENFGLGEAEVTLTTEVVTIRRKGSSSTEVAKILGIERKDDSVDIWLDRLVHARHEDRIGPSGKPEAQFAVSGVFVSVLACGVRTYADSLDIPEDVSVPAS